jgi:hypothetical protein
VKFPHFDLNIWEKGLEKLEKSIGFLPCSLICYLNRPSFKQPFGLGMLLAAGKMMMSRSASCHAEIVR